MSFAESIATKILKCGITIRTLREWQRESKADSDIAFENICDGIRERVLNLIQRRVSDDDWLSFAALPDSEKYKEEFTSIAFEKACDAYARGYIDGFSDRESLFDELYFSAFMRGEKNDSTEKK